MKYECPRCQHVIVIPVSIPQGWTHLPPERCPECGATWPAGQAHMYDEIQRCRYAISEIAAALSEILKAMAKNPAAFQEEARRLQLALDDANEGCHHTVHPDTPELIPAYAEICKRRGEFPR